MDCARSVGLRFTLLVLGCLGIGALHANGFLDDLDYCKGEQRDFASTAEAYEAHATTSLNNWDAWYKDPKSIPDAMLASYIARVKSFTFQGWQATDTGAATIRSWREKHILDTLAKFYEFIYPTLMSPSDEDAASRALFKKDYDLGSKKTLTTNLERGRQNYIARGHKIDQGCKSDVLSQAIRVSLVGPFMLVDHNLKDARDERGEYAKAVHATSGISIESIFQNGLRGSEGSEANKLKKTWEDTLTKSGIGPNSVIRQVLRNIDPTNIKGVPTQLQVTVDGDSLRNVVHNLTFGVF
jgi:hypothetical protein